MIKPNEENPIYQKSLAPRGPAVPAAPAQVGTISADESGKSMKIMENPEPLKRKIHEIMENPEPLKILQIHGGGGLAEAPASPGLTLRGQQATKTDIVPKISTVTFVLLYS